MQTSKGTLASSVDVTVPTELCEIMARNHSDKGAPWITQSAHNYTTLYTKLFASRRHLPLRIFEMGLGTNNVNLPSNMGANGRPGASLYGWRDYFPNASIHGGDIDSCILFTDNRIDTYYCDQTNPDAIAQMWNDPRLAEPFDIMIDDGLHTYDANVCLLENSIHKMARNGIYIIEDIDLKNFHLFEAKIPEWRAKYPNHRFELVELPPALFKNDNNLLVVTGPHLFIENPDEVDTFPVTTPVKYHCVWFGEPLDHHVLCLSSLFATQRNPDVTLWTSEAFIDNLRTYFMPKFGHHAFKVEVFRSIYEGVLYPKEEEHRLWTCDDWRLDILYTHGGIYVDLDNLFLKDISWVSRYPAMSQWGGDKRCNSSIASFQAGDPELRKLIDIMGRIPDRKGWHRTVPNFEWTLPVSVYCFACPFFDPVWWDDPTLFDGFFTGMAGETRAFKDSYVYHWHNRWALPVRDPNTLVGKYWAKFVRSPNCLETH
jgi:hypothetical protein